MKANCVVCGKEFEARCKTFKTCSQECAKEKNRRYAHEHRDQQNSLRRLRYLDNPELAERLRVKSKQYYVANAESRRECSRQYKRANPAKHKASVRDWQKTNAEYINTYHREYWKANPEQCRKYGREHQRSVRAAKALGISIPKYALMQMIKRLTQSQEQPNDQASDQSV